MSLNIDVIKLSILFFKKYTDAYLLQSYTFNIPNILTEQTFINVIIFCNKFKKYISK